MKSTGMVRRVDELGRIVLPKEMRTVMDIAEHDPLEIFVDNGHIILKKYQPSCVFCGGSEGVAVFKDKNICKACTDEIKAVIRAT